MTTAAASLLQCATNAKTAAGGWTIPSRKTTRTGSRLWPHPAAATKPAITCRSAFWRPYDPLPRLRPPTLARGRRSDESKALDLRQVLVPVFARPPAGQGGNMNHIKYTGPAKPIPTKSERKIFIAECVVFLLGIFVVGFDVYVWRADFAL